jgi:PAS domain S-box-containing protein
MNHNKTKISSELEAIFEHFPDGIITLTATRPYLITNINSVACQLLQAQKTEILGKTIRSAFGEDDSALLQVIEETATQKRPVRNFNVEIENDKGDSKILLLNTEIVSNERLPAPRILLILHDISEVSHLQRKPDISDSFEKLVGSTAEIRKVFSTIEIVAPTDAAVLIYGETGTGKELVARAIHRRSGRANRPFIPVHCSAITDSLLESDLFGHTKGAFTGAIRDKPGRFELADGGTIFLDEIATLSQEIQVNLLRVLQEKTIERVGETKSTKVDVRVISATNRHLPDLIRQGVFRKDLYYRIKVLQIDLPPLQNRKKDIPPLSAHFIEKYNQQHGCNILGLTRASLRILKNYSWPGNVRELENAIEHAVILAQKHLIKPEHLPEEICHNSKNVLAHSEFENEGFSESDKIRNALQKTAGNVTRAAALLGVHRTTLWRKMRELHIPRLPGSI